jgi:hypothetical protein
VFPCPRTYIRQQPQLASHRVQVHCVFNSFLDANDHVAVLELLQAFFKHQPPVFDSHYILRYLSVSVCSRKDGAILSRIIAFSRDNGMRHAMFADEDTSPSLLAAKSGNLSAVKALQDEGTFDCTCRDMETGLNAAQFAIMNGHDDVLEHIMYFSPGTCIAARPS